MANGRDGGERGAEIRERERGKSPSPTVRGRPVVSLPSPVTEGSLPQALPPAPRGLLSAREPAVQRRPLLRSPYQQLLPGVLQSGTPSLSPSHRTLVLIPFFLPAKVQG